MNTPLVMFAVASIVANAAADDERTLADFAGDTSAYRLDAGDGVTAGDAFLTMSAPGGAGVGFTVRPAGDAANAAWDVDAFSRFGVDVENLSAVEAHLRFRAVNPGGNDWSGSTIGDGYVPAGARKTFVVNIFRKGDDLKRFPALGAFSGMRGLPGGFQSHWHTLDARDVRAVSLSLAPAAIPQALRVHSIRATHPVVPTMLRDKGAAFFPFVDRYGQYRWEDWPGKIDRDAQLIEAFADEQRDLAAHPPHPDRNAWGGWAEGPQLAKAKFFRAEKHEGRWWLVDPAGRLFWSHGASSVGYGSAATIVSRRAHYFADLPPRAGEHADAWSEHDQAGTPVEMFDHLKANLRRQLGPTWQARLPDLTHARLGSWGLNTIGAWSDRAIIAARRTPYTMIVHPNKPQVRTLLPDTFDPAFAATIGESIKRSVGDAAGDPWCIGFFIDNELHWGNDSMHVVGDLFAAPPAAFAKRELVRRLRDHLGTIDAANAALGTSHVSWDAFAESTKPLAATRLEPVRALVEAFFGELADRYFEACKAALAEAAPGQLYLGCRMHVQGRIVVEAAARHCDVLSFNRYEHSTAGFDAYGVDKPVIISEFHFGALGRGMLGTGLRAASDPADRARKYRAYVEGALGNPRIVGTHWFAFAPQAITGRADGENFSVGLFDVTNRPDAELRNALRHVSKSMYARRAASATRPAGG